MSGLAFTHSGRGVGGDEVFPVPPALMGFGATVGGARVEGRPHRSATRPDDGVWPVAAALREIRPGRNSHLACHSGVRHADSMINRSNNRYPYLNIVSKEKKNGHCSSALVEGAGHGAEGSPRRPGSRRGRSGRVSRRRLPCRAGADAESARPCGIRLGAGGEAGYAVARGAPPGQGVPRG